jgi:preprotein translocase subunit SecY
MYYEEGEIGRAKFNQYARILTVPLALIQSFGFLNFLNAQGVIFLTPLTLIRDAIIVTCSVIILMWIGELITETKTWQWHFFNYFFGNCCRNPTNIASGLCNFLIRKTTNLYSLFDFSSFNCSWHCFY